MEPHPLIRRQLLSSQQPDAPNLPVDSAQQGIEGLKAAVRQIPPLKDILSLATPCLAKDDSPKREALTMKRSRSIPIILGALSNLGVVYYQTGELDKAIANFKKVLSLDTQDAATHYLYGATLLQMSNYAEGGAAIRRCVGDSTRSA